MNVYELIQLLAQLPPDTELAHRTEEGLIVEVSADDFVIVPPGASYIPSGNDGELMGPALVIGGDPACVCPWKKDPAVHGADDAEVYLSETDRTPEEIAALVERTRRGHHVLPDEMLINAMGRGWVLKTAGAPDDSDASWEAYGLPWCQRYNEAYLSRLEEGARS